jgi:hypothetical protein
MTEDDSLQTSAPNQARLEAAKKKIRTAWMFGLISTIMTLIDIIVAMVSSDIEAPFGLIGLSAWNLLDVLVLGGADLWHI